MHGGHPPGAPPLLSTGTAPPTPLPATSGTLVPTVAPPFPAASTPVPVTQDMITNGLIEFVGNESSSAAPLDHICDDTTFCASPTGQLAEVLRQAANISQTDLDDAAALLDPASVGRYLQGLGRTLTHDASCIAARPFMMFPTVDTSAELFITDHLGNVALRLVNKRYGGASTGHSYIIMGPRGCGKTVALKRFALTAMLRFPKLCVVHISAEHIASVSWRSICAFVMKTMLGAGAQGVPDALSFVDFCAFLKRADRYCMLVVDEIEYLYMVDRQCTWIHRVLQDLAAFSGSENGRTSFIGCSSTHLAYPLVKGAGAISPDLRRTLFPAFVDVNPPKMNGSKLQPVWIPSASPTDTTALQPFFQCQDVKLRRVITFVIGSNVRTLYRRAVTSDLRQAPSDSISLAALSSPLSGHTLPFLSVFPEASAFLLGAYRRMYDQNRDLLQRCLLHPISGTSAPNIALSRLDAAFIGQTDWHREFKPLTWTDIEDIFKEDIPVLEGHAALGIGLQQEVVDFLVLDVALLVALYDGGVRSERYVKLYPKSMLAVLLQDQATASSQFTADNVRHVVRQTAVDAPSALRRGIVTRANYNAFAAGGLDLMKAAVGKATPGK